MPAPPTDFDLVIVGGGINGAGIARDAALRGLTVLLLEKNDFGSGTSSWSSRLIHGGLRYLEYGELPLVFESLRERRQLRRVAPHLVKRLRIKIPVYRRGRRSLFVVRLGMIAYDLLSLGKSVPRHRILNRQAFLAQEPGIKADGLVGGASYFDAQVTFAERLVLENVLGAKQAGAEVRNYSPVIGIHVRQRKVRSVEYLDPLSGEEREVSTRMVINAAGPWVDRVLRTVNREIRGLMGGTKGSHIVVGKFAEAPRDAFYIEAAEDGRPFFIIPWNQQYLIGTTDLRYQGDPGEVVASDEEIEYLLRETNRVFPAANLSVDDIHFAYAGVRPLPRRAKGPEAAITRKHIIKKHGRQAKGLVSIVGGKLTTYRNLAEQTVDFAVRVLKIPAKACATRTLYLPGGENIEQARRELVAIKYLSAMGRERMLHIYGGATLQIVALAESEPALHGTVDDADTVMRAEVVYAIRNEFALSLIDIVHRRLMIGLSADQGAHMADTIAGIAASELNWSGSGKAAQLQMLQTYNQRLKPARQA